VQGVTEFLPVSSKGHLVLAESLLGLATPGVMVEVLLHVATLTAVVIVYRTRIWDLLRHGASGDGASWRYVGMLALATLPAGVVGITFQRTIERAFDSVLITGIGFLATGTILWSTRRAQDRGGDAELTFGRAWTIGLAQAFAILPGVSRSGTTVSAGLWSRVDAVRAAEFSFLLSIPVIVGAAILQLPHLSSDVSRVGVGFLVAGFLAALLSGIGAITLLLVLLRRRAFHQFAPYLWLLGTATVGWGVWRG